MSANPVDIILRRLLLFSRTFSKSWGSPNTLKCLKTMIDEMTNDFSVELIERAQTKMVITKEYQKNGCKYVEGQFSSPLARYAPSVFPAENVKICRWKALIAPEEKRAGAVIQLAATGDHSYRIREMVYANQLLEQGVSSLLVENPFYGDRKPEGQFRSNLSNVSDLFVIGAALITECCFLLQWLYSQGHYPLALSGVSLGGYNAGLAASNAPFPIAVIPCLSWTTAAPVYTKGALASAINWTALEAELDLREFRDAISLIDSEWLDKIHAPELFGEGFSRAERFMWLLMEDYTNLKRFPTPYRSDLAKFIIAAEDAYIIRDGAPHINELWNEAEVLTLPNVGHVLGFIQHGDLFRKTVIEMLAKTILLPANVREIDQ